MTELKQKLSLNQKKSSVKAFVRTELWVPIPNFEREGLRERERVRRFERESESEPVWESERPSNCSMPEKFSDIHPKMKSRRPCLPPLLAV